MRAVVQRVLSSNVKVDGVVVGSISRGLNLLLGVEKEDTFEDLLYLKDKILNLRIFEDENGKMNKSLLDINGELIVVSQFTLLGDCRKGRRPNFMNALSGDNAEKFYLKFLEECKKQVCKVECGVFGADMQVYIENDGPVTLLIDSKKTF
ncbi:D-aminoacyl-tRNA deacylase [Haloimpatiens sp. FM7315]|uniref:D-aminoacyl-tRNA deacylase n=1 Tax=Haloimpatiens sp. FM7315 TaxID=3298609 RepID=UPI00370BD9A8